MLAAKPINDDERVRIDFSLPLGFAYVLAEVYANIVQDVAAAWDPFGFLELHNTSKATEGLDIRIPVPFESMSNTGAGGFNQRASNVPAGTLLRSPICAVPSSTFKLQFTNQSDPAGAAGTIDALISFWEYDLEQVTWYPIHSAANVVVR